MKKIMMVLLLLFISGSALADGENEMPAFFGFQSELTDDGGNPLPDGPLNIVFRITDEGGIVLYEESQDIDVVNGQINAMVGNGLDISSGSPKGGVPSDILLPDGSRYLQVEVAGQMPYDKMEIVSVPYAIYADTALKVADGAISQGMIASGAIKKEHLSEELISYLETDILARAASSGSFSQFVNDVQSPVGASKVGVSSSFVYSGSATVQGVLKDMDMAVKRRQDEIELARADYASKISSEAFSRQNADVNEAAVRNSADASIRSSVTAETSARINADSSIQGQISTHASSTSTHGVKGKIVGDSDAQSLSNKTLIAPVITGGAAVGGSLSVTGSVEVSRIESSSGGPRLTPFAYATINELVDDAPAFENSYNIARVTTECCTSDRQYTLYFSSRATDDKYVVMATPEGTDDCGATTAGPNPDEICYTYVVGKTTAGFSIHTSRSNIMNVLVFDDN